MGRFGLHVTSTVALIVVLVVYVWVESSLTDSAVSKVLLVSLYGLVAVLSEYFLTRFVGYDLATAIRMNLLATVLISLWLVFSAVVFHPGLTKDRPITLISASAAFLRFLCTIGLATTLLRLLAAFFFGRSVGPEARPSSQ